MAEDDDEGDDELPCVDTVLLVQWGRCKNKLGILKTHIQILCSLKTKQFDVLFLNSEPVDNF